MSNKKLVLGIAAGVAALAVVGVICKRKGYFDNFGERAEEFGSGLKDKFADIKDSAKSKFDELVQKGGDIADKVSNHAGDAADTASKAASSIKNTGNTGSNPATT